MREPRKIPELTQSDVARFVRFVSRAESGCHVWRGAKDAKGYGHFGIRSEQHRAHRIAFAIWHKKDPGRSLVCHSCDNPSCVNPEHLWLGSAAENTRDMVAKGRSKFSCRTIVNGGNCARCGHVRDDDYIDRRGGRRCRQCKKNYDALTSSSFVREDA